MTIGEIMLYSGIGLAILSVFGLIISQIYFHIKGKNVKEDLNKDYDF